MGDTFAEEKNTVSFFEGFVLVPVSIATCKSKLRRKDLLGLHSHISVLVTEGSLDRNSSRPGTWRQKLMLKTWRVLLVGLLSWLVNSAFL